VQVGVAAHGSRGMRWRVWAVRENVGQPGKERAGPGSREQCQTEHDLIRSKTGFILIKFF
jgi:hypothetical protein